MYSKKLFEIVEDDNMNTLINDLETKIAEMQKTLEEAKQAEAKRLKRKVWKPDIGDKYYFVTHKGETSWYINSNSTTDKQLINTNSCFKTLKEAERKAFELKLMNDLKVFAQENNEDDIDWSKSNYKYFLYCNCEHNEIFIGSANTYKQIGQIYFTSERVAREALTIYKTDLLRYFTTKE